jgi:hypothetical protein
LLFSMPGRTFATPILAVEMMPHFTGFIECLPNLGGHS